MSFERPVGLVGIVFKVRNMPVSEELIEIIFLRSKDNVQFFDIFIWITWIFWVVVTALLSIQ